VSKVFLSYVTSLVLTSEQNSVMMGWEEPLMKEHVRLMCNAHPKMQKGATEGLNILNIGYGLGIVSTIPSPASHCLS
jgi:protein arginine N-methyltransferase 2